MAKQTLNLAFKSAQISLEDNTITEVLKDSVEVHSLSEVLRQFEGDGKFVDITFKESSDVLGNGE